MPACRHSGTDARAGSQYCTYNYTTLQVFLKSIQYVVLSARHTSEMEFLDINLTKTEVFCSMLFTVPSTGGF